MTSIEYISGYEAMNESIKISVKEYILDIQFTGINNNAITGNMIKELSEIIETYRERTKVVILRGNEAFFCSGISFGDVIESNEKENYSAGLLYELWEELSFGSFVSIAVVEGSVTAGGMGFAACCDIVIGKTNARFQLTELLFGLYPACVLPFLIKKIGYSKAHYLSLTAQAIDVYQAIDYGLVDFIDNESEAGLRKLVLRYKYIDKKTISAYKQYADTIYDIVSESKKLAIDKNHELFTDPGTIENISNYVNSGKFPWE